MTEQVMTTLLLPAFGWTVRTGLEACAIAAGVLLVQRLLGDRVSARWRYNLWLLVLARLVLPAVPSRFSPFNAVALNDAQPPARPASVAAAEPTQPLAATETAADERLAARRKSGPATPVVAHPAEVPAVAIIESPPSPAERPVPAVNARVPAEPVAPSAETHVPLPGPLAAWESGAGAGAPREGLITPSSTRSACALAAASRGVAPAAASVPDPKPLAWEEHGDVAAAAPVASQRFSWKHRLALTWLAGVLVCLARLAAHTLLLSRRLVQRPHATEPDLQSQLNEAAADVGVQRVPQLLLAPDDLPPALVGVRRPRLLLSRAVLTSLRPDELRLVLLHELAHLKRRDVLANWVLGALSSLHWFNPLVRLAFRRIRADRELACDEQVLRVCARPDAGGARGDYGKTIINVLHALSRHAAGGTPASAAAVGVLDGKNFLRRRIAMIARLERTARGGGDARRRWPVVGLAASALLAAVALTGPVRGQDEPKPVGPATAEPSRDPAGRRPALEVEKPAGAEGPGFDSVFVKPPAGAAPHDGQEPPRAEKPGRQTKQIAGEGGHDRSATTVLEADVMEARARLEAAEVAAELARDEAERAEALARNATISTSELAKIQAAARIATTQIEIARAGLVRAEAALRARDKVTAHEHGHAHDPAAEAGEGFAGGGGFGGGGGGFAGGGGHFGGGGGGLGGGEVVGSLRTRVEDPAAREADAKTWATLRKNMPVQFHNVKLQEVLEFISEASGVTLFPDWKRLADVDVTPDKEVTLNAKGSLPVEQVLGLALRAVGGSHVTFALDRGVVVVTTTEAVGTMLVTRSYDVRDLKAAWQLLPEVVREAVNPESWREAGGVNAIRMFGGEQLIVTASEPTHREVEKMLALLRGTAPREEAAAALKAADPADRTQAAATALSRQSAGKWVFVPQPASKAVDRIARESGVAIHLDAEGLKAAGLDPTKRIELQMAPSDFTSALLTVLQQAGDDHVGGVGALVVDGEVRVSSVDKLRATYGARNDVYWLIGGSGRELNVTIDELFGRPKPAAGGGEGQRGSNPGKDPQSRELWEREYAPKVVYADEGGRRRPINLKAVTDAFEADVAKRAEEGAAAPDSH